MKSNTKQKQESPRYIELVLRIRLDHIRVILVISETNQQRERRKDDQ